MKTGSIAVMLTGRVGSDPQVATSGAGRNFAKFSVAVSSSYVDRDGNNQEKTEWFPVSCRDHAPNLGAGTIASRYIKKGMMVIVSGRLEISEKEGKTYVAIVVDGDPATNIQFFETAKRLQTSNQSQPQAQQPQAQQPQAQQPRVSQPQQPQAQQPRVSQPQQSYQDDGYGGYNSGNQEANGPLPPMPSFPNGNPVLDDDIPL